MKARLGPGANEQLLAVSIGVAARTLSHWRTGKTVPSEYQCVTIAEILQAHPLQVVVSAAKERDAAAGRPTAIWDALADLLPEERPAGLPEPAYGTVGRGRIEG